LRQEQSLNFFIRWQNSIGFRTFVPGPTTFILPKLIEFQDLARLNKTITCATGLIQRRAKIMCVTIYFLQSVWILAGKSKILAFFFSGRYADLTGNTRLGQPVFCFLKVHTRCVIKPVDNNMPRVYIRCDIQNN
jgi:hypothetical protein